MAKKRDISGIENWRTLVKVDINQAASEFASLPAEDVSACLEQLGLDSLAEIVSRLATDAAAGMVRNLPEEAGRLLLAKLPAEKSASLKEILAYKPGTAGSLMAKEFLTIPVGFTIRQAIEYLQSLPQDKKGKVSYIYVINDQSRIEGVIQVRDLIFYGPDKSVKDVLKNPVVQVETGMTQLDVARLLQRHRYLGLPVVNETQQLVGVISADNALQVFEKEAAEDIANILGTSPEEIKTHSLKKVMALRLPWLSFNIVSGLICALISGIFQKNIQAVTTLFLFIPVVLGLSESTGIQSAAIAARGIAASHLAFNHLRGLFLREIGAGIFIGLICGGIVGASGFFWKSSPLLGWALACSMTAVIINSALIGLLLPLLFKKIRIDPSLATGPLVLALCDIQTLFVYFNLSVFILSH